MLGEMNGDYKAIMEENKRLQEELKRRTGTLQIEEGKGEDTMLQQELGPKYNELGGAIEEAKQNLKRIAEDVR